MYNPKDTVIRVDYRQGFFENKGTPQDAWVTEWEDFDGTMGRNQISPPTTEGLLEAVNDAFLSAINRQREGMKTFVSIHAPNKIYTLCLLPPQEIFDGTIIRSHQHKEL